MCFSLTHMRLLSAYACVCVCVCMWQQWQFAFASSNNLQREKPAPICCWQLSACVARCIMCTGTYIQIHIYIQTSACYWTSLSTASAFCSEAKCEKCKCRNNCTCFYELPATFRIVHPTFAVIHLIFRYFSFQYCSMCVAVSWCVWLLIYFSILSVATMAGIERVSTLSRSSWTCCCYQPNEVL